MRWLILLHRYLGIAVGWLLVAWCLSGVVMMYVAYPELGFDEYLDALPTLDLSRCCRLDTRDPPSDEELSALAVEMLAVRPVARLRDAFGRTRTVDLETGAPIDRIDAAQAAEIVAALEKPPGRPRLVETLDSDQWTVTANYAADRPLHRFELGDAARSEWYLSSRSGQLVQTTTANERFWNWLGSVVHWIYPAVLRANPALWNQVVIWASGIGTFLTTVGLYIGIRQLKRRRNGRLSPYRGLALWHHWLGLAFGVLTLTWVASGLLSMDPWGWLEGGGGGADARALAGRAYTVADAARWLDALPDAPLPPGTKRIEAAPFQGEAFLVAYDGNGELERYAAETLTPSRLTTAELAAAAPTLAPEAGLASAELLSHEDAYYFSHHIERPLPVFRVIANDADATRYYLDPATGRLVGRFDSGRRTYRWFFEALHRLDFTASIRRRPLWDALVLVLLAGVTAVCATGTYLGIRFLLR